MKQDATLMQIKLSANFRLKEFYVSSKHPREALAMEVLPEHIASLSRLSNVLLEPIRSIVDHPVTVSSGVRDTTLNMLVGGSKTSQHLRAEVGDLELKGDEAWDVFKELRDNENMKPVIGQCIIYLTVNKIPYFLHVSIPSLDEQAKPVGDFRVKLSGDSKYYKWGLEEIPGVDSPYVATPEPAPEPEPEIEPEPEPEIEVTDDNPETEDDKGDSGDKPRHSFFGRD